MADIAGLELQRGDSMCVCWDRQNLAVDNYYIAIMGMADADFH